MTQPNVQATIKVVTEYIYPTEFTVTGLQSAFGNNLQVTSGAVVEPGGFETREVGVILSVLADVSPETQLINLTMTPEVVTDPLWHNYGSIYTDANGREVRLNMEQPFFHTRSISTSILIQNEATVVMGGMITERRDTIDDRVPFLGDIPLVGRLFRSKAENSEKRNLLIFVTARLFGADGRPIGTQTKLPTIAAKAE
jgi:general secretion pathway protein D